jgi:hypothetical protein
MKALNHDDKLFFTEKVFLQKERERVCENAGAYSNAKSALVSKWHCNHILLCNRFVLELKPLSC